MLILFFSHFHNRCLNNLIAKCNMVDATIWFLLQVIKGLSRNYRHLKFFLVTLIKMLSKLHLIFLLKFDIIFDKVIIPVLWFFAVLLISSIEFGFIKKSHLDYLLIVYHLFLLIQVHLFEIWPVFVCWRYIWSNFIETRGCYQRF